MIPIEELKLILQTGCTTSIAAFWWYLLRNWNPGNHSSTKQSNFFWWYLLRNWNNPSDFTVFQNILPFDDTYWGIETVSVVHFEETQKLLMIPIEELKPAVFAIYNASCTSFDDTYWGIETRFLRVSAFWIINFWWYLLRNWNPHPWPPTKMILQSFWWYLLRNWNSEMRASPVHPEMLLMIPIEELKHYNNAAGQLEDMLLMIPIEELKPFTCPSSSKNIPSFWWYLLRNWNKEATPWTKSCWAFDDTYWGIETNYISYNNPWVLLLMIPIEELKLQDFIRDSQLRAGFWWYLLRNWNLPA